MYGTRFLMTLAICAAGLCPGTVAATPPVTTIAQWTFDSPVNLNTWVPNKHLADVSVRDGILHARAIDWDPFFWNRSVHFTAANTQYIHIRIKADTSGYCDLFWSGTSEGPDAGLTEGKKVRLRLRGGENWQDLYFFPFWQSEGTICQLRFDVYDHARFAIDSIAIEDWGTNETPLASLPPAHWWKQRVIGSTAFAPRLALKTDGLRWATVRMKSTESGPAALVWASAAAPGGHEHVFEVIGDNRWHDYPVELGGQPGWKGTINVFGLRLPPGKATIASLSLGEQPVGPAELEITRFGFVNAPNRAGKPCALMLRIRNRGAGSTEIRPPVLRTGRGLTVVEKPGAEARSLEGLGAFTDFIWQVQAEKPGTYTVSVASLGREGVLGATRTTLQFTPDPGLPQAGYVPEPHPIKTALDVCAYYFPGWNAAAKWDCIRSTAPVRKPMLGYYDEGNPEVVDWQIKWAVENGISCFLVDWYWRLGTQHLTHWFEAYRKARYRDMLKVAIMWANHLPPGSHTAEDWRTVTQYWINHYFSLPGYYRIDGKPALFLWSPDNLRRDLGGSEAVRKSLSESQELARAAGYRGITFVALNVSLSRSNVETLYREGYQGITSYHEWGNPLTDTGSELRREYADIPQTVPGVWRRKNHDARPLVYYPVADTGWDSRPWHGEKSLVIQGRTPTLFRKILQEEKAFCEQHHRTIAILGPLNEWGEGSYIEPNTEFGFAMYEQVRSVFGTGDPRQWPLNIAPSDVGLGPYDYPRERPVTAWDFKENATGWTSMMNIADFCCENGALHFRTTTNDGALMVNLVRLQARSYPVLELTMKITGTPGKQQIDTAQVFWSRDGNSISEGASIRFAVQVDGEIHTYRVPLADNPEWRGTITMLRFDPSDKPNRVFQLSSFRFIKTKP